ncbi:hypothetical protein Rt10032_c14g5359 [Rhodotorula toruloides]|uniref:Uncharacterized protein n=1 Tax=Rhodotorula toruloides TaxID=5286 RepID=A0A511KLU1_RHOTO|nr:hypothetical protein Rt10032_c14g5359 [Rhodotorula toruloides]
MPGRAASSPSVFGVSGLKTAYAAPSAHRTKAELEGSALKKVLLANLRARMATGGSASKAAEVGLRFKKFAVWNAWNRRPQEPLEEVNEQEADPAAEAHVIYDELPLNENVGAGAVDTVEVGLPLPDPPAELVDEWEPTDLLLASDEASAVFTSLFNDGESQETTASLKSGRPRLRRRTSLPNISSGERSDSRGSRSASSSKYAYRREEYQRRRGMWEASGWTFVTK